MSRKKVYRIAPVLTPFEAEAILMELEGKPHRRQSALHSAKVELRRVIGHKRDLARTVGRRSG